MNEPDIYFFDSYIKLYEDIEDGNLTNFHYAKGKLNGTYKFIKSPIEQSFSNNNYFDIRTAYGYGGPYFNNTDQGFINEFFSEFEKYCKEEKIVAEFLRCHPLIGNHTYLSNYYNLIFDRKTVVVNLIDGKENVWNKQMSSKNRNIIRKSQQKGHYVKISEHPSDEEKKEFIKAYNYTMENLNASKFYKFSNDFFEKMFRNLRGNLIVCSAYNKEHNLLGSTIFLFHNDYIHYHLSARTIHSDNTATNLIIYSAIEYAINKGMKFMHLGGGRTNKAEDSLLRFKESFSDISGDYFIGSKIHDLDTYNTICRIWSEKLKINPDVFKNIILKYRINDR